LNLQLSKRGHDRFPFGPARVLLASGIFHGAQFSLDAILCHYRRAGTSFGQAASSGTNSCRKERKAGIPFSGMPADF
jgi:hypothetical protein